MVKKKSWCTLGQLKSENTNNKLTPPNRGVFYLSAPPKDLSTLPNLNKCTTSCFQNTTPLLKNVLYTEKKFLENFGEFTIFVKWKVRKIKYRN